MHNCSLYQRADFLMLVFLTWDGPPLSKVNISDVLNLSYHMVHGILRKVNYDRCSREGCESQYTLAKQDLVPEFVHTEKNIKRKKNDLLRLFRFAQLGKENVTAYCTK